MIKTIDCIYKAYIEKGNVAVECLANLKEKILLSKLNYNEESANFVMKLEDLIFSQKGEKRDIEKEIKHSKVEDEIKAELLNIIYSIPVGI